MNRALIILSIVMIVLICGVTAYGWEVTYDASTGVAPSSASPAWHKAGILEPAFSDGLLHIMDSASTGNLDYLCYSRDGYAIDPGVPVTVEARVKVISVSEPFPGWSTVLGVQTKGATVRLALYPDHIYAFGTTYQADLTSLRTIRLAMDANYQANVWIDGQFAFSLTALGGGQDGVFFGAGLREATSDSYWDYVSYSKEYLPVPEPSALMALAGGLGALGLPMLRRKME